MNGGLDDLDAGFDGYSAERIAIDPDVVVANDDPQAAPLRKVWAMVLTVAVVDYLVAKPKSRRFLEAKDWIFYGQARAANSFDNVAHFLDFPPERLRRAIACRREEIWSEPEKVLEVLDIVRGTPAAGWLA